MLVAIAAGVVAGGMKTLAQESTAPAYAAVVVPKMCCGKESKPAINELLKVDGVSNVIADHKERTLTVFAKPGDKPSPRAIWEAVERLKLQPVELRTADAKFIEKPKR
jgi:copper chaperone CopZ